MSVVQPMVLYTDVNLNEEIRVMAEKGISTYNSDSLKFADEIDDRTFKDMKYARIIDLIAEEQNVSLEKAKDIFYSSPLFELFDDGTDDLICQSDLYLANQIIRTHGQSALSSTK